MSEEDDLFDNGIDGEPYANNNNEALLNSYYDIHEDGGIIIHDDIEKHTMVVYYCGQWNDSGMDPDTIVISIDEGDWKAPTYRVAFDKEEARIVTPTKKFKLHASFKLQDFVGVISPVKIICNNTNTGDLVDSIAAKTTQIVFDKDKFKDKLERFQRLLVFS